jgi:hypothetical protein
MWILIAIPAVAASLINLIALVASDAPRWQKGAVTVLTILAVGAFFLGAWWPQHEKQIEDARRTEVRERLGYFIDEGQSMLNMMRSNKQPSIEQRDKWASETESFLKQLGDSYVTRFRSDAGITDVFTPGGNDFNWRFVNDRVTRLHEFSAEFSGQVPLHLSRIAVRPPSWSLIGRGVL